jgi:amidohydrolase
MNTSLLETIHHLAAEYDNDTIELRRHLHQNPELSFEEKTTSEFIQHQLKKLEIPFKSGVAGTGIIATLTGKKAKGRVIALRADMDALPIIENTQLPYQSINKGVMHACGHDAHTASLLGTARILKELQNQWEGTLLFIFQPGEEKFPGGASLLLKEGALDHPKPEIILGQHVLPEMESGHVGFRKGMYMASGDEVHLTIKGKGGHAAMPHNLNDTVLAACQVIVALQQVVSRLVPATIPAVLSFGRIVGNGATNVIPEKVEMSGTFRIMDENWRAIVKDKIRHIATTTANSFGCQCEVDIKDGYPMVYNNEAVTEQAQNWAREYLGDSNVEEMDLRMTAEDFGYYTREFPCTFYRFGVKQSDGDTGGLHTPQFNLNEQSLKTSSGLMAWLALNFLKTNQTAS